MYGKTILILYKSNMCYMKIILYFLNQQTNTQIVRSRSNQVTPVLRIIQPTTMGLFSVSQDTQNNEKFVYEI